jgi:hemerythrin-like domain-containing protein
MRPTDILSDEHRVIVQVLDCLEKMVDESRAQGRLEAEPARDAVSFFRMFADRCHHGKEEAHLFPAMEAKGFSRDHGPTGVMRHEHDLGRAHVRGMDEAIDAASAGDPRALEQFTEHARAYVELLQEHIQKEDHCLFAMANQAFSDEDQRALMQAFEKVEAEEMGEGTHETYLKIANDLADRFGVARAASEHHACGCGH